MISNDDVSIRKLLFQTIKNFLFPKGSTSPCSTQPLQFSSPSHVEGISLRSCAYYDSCTEGDKRTIGLNGPSELLSWNYKESIPAHIAHILRKTGTKNKPRRSGGVCPCDLPDINRLTLQLIIVSTLYHTTHQQQPCYQHGISLRFRNTRHLCQSKGRGVTGTGIERAYIKGRVGHTAGR
ncbi:hypothetical protein NNRS527_02051 [Nitrosospira sp. NRS527]|nr:hypothetical protein NNRS527_02051 [Nitrosospira sp. NRS527]